MASMSKNSSSLSLTTSNGKRMSAFAFFKAKAKHTLGISENDSSVKGLSISKLVENSMPVVIGTSLGEQDKVVALKSHNPNDNHSVTNNSPDISIVGGRSNSERRRRNRRSEKRRLSLQNGALIVHQSNASNTVTTKGQITTGQSSSFDTRHSQSKRGRHLSAAADVGTSSNLFINSEMRRVLDKRRSRPVSDPSEISVNSVLGPPAKRSREKLNTGTKEVKAAKPVSSSSINSIPTLLMYDSTEEANRVVDWLISPVPREKFFNELWEKKPLLLRRHQPEYFSNIFSTQEFSDILKQESLDFSVNIDITRYVNGKRETLNPIGRAYAPVVWNFYEEGCSVRLLNPQTYSKSVWKLNSDLQEAFGTFVGSNVYLTPPGTQGFAPHWDDIEAFIMQLEGKKKWKVYAPRSEEEKLPRFSSQNFTENEIGKPILEATLEAGDLLYLPRGFIHQAMAQDKNHSLHITVSTTQQNCWGDYFEKLLPQALQLAIAEDVSFRKSLPRDYLNYVGLAHSESEDIRRQQFIEKANKLFLKIWDHVLLDSAADQMGKKYILDSLPPYLTENEKACSIHGSGSSWMSGSIVNKTNLTLNSKVKLLRRNCLRLVMEGDTQTFLYHNVENSRIYHDKEAVSFEIDAELAPGVEFLIESYPDYVTLDALPLESAEFKITLGVTLYEKGLILTEESFSSSSNDVEIEVLEPEEIQLV